MKIPYSFKKCSKCGGWLVSSAINFSRQKNGKYGLTSKCKKCKKRYYEEKDFSNCINADVPRR